MTLECGYSSPQLDRNQLTIYVVATGVLRGIRCLELVVALQDLSVKRGDKISENKILTDIQAKLVHTEKCNYREGKHEIL